MIAFITHMPAQRFKCRFLIPLLTIAFVVCIAFVASRPAPYSFTLISNVSAFDKTLILVGTYYEGFSNRNPLKWNPEKTGNTITQEYHFAICYSFVAENPELSALTSFWLPHFRGASNENWRAVSASNFLYRGTTGGGRRAAKYWNSTSRVFTSEITGDRRIDEFVEPCFIFTKSGAKLMVNEPECRELNGLTGEICSNQRTRDLMSAAKQNYVANFAIVNWTENGEYLWVEDRNSTNKITLYQAVGEKHSVSFPGQPDATIEQVEVLDNKFVLRAKSQDLIYVQDSDQRISSLKAHYQDVYWDPLLGRMLLIPLGSFSLLPECLERPFDLWMYRENRHYYFKLNYGDLVHQQECLARTLKNVK